MRVQKTIEFDLDVNLGILPFDKKSGSFVLSARDMDCLIDVHLIGVRHKIRAEILAAMSQMVLSAQPPVKK